jgi:hypothetical protein
VQACSAQYRLQFSKCQNVACSHCGERPVKAQKAMRFLRQHEGRIFTPTPCIIYPGHFKSFLQCCHQYKVSSTMLAPDEGLPSGYGRHCTHGCPAFYFMSAEDEEKHNRVLHSKRSRLSGDAVNSALKRLCHSCTFPECNLSFSTQYRLQQHKEHCGHKLEKGRPRRS